MRGWLVIGLAVSVLVAGCISDGPRDWGPLAVERSNGNGDQARTEGVLQFDAGCVFLVGGNERTLLGWPDQRTTWDGRTSTILYVHGDGTVARLFDGQHWAFGGSGDFFAAVVQRLEWVVPPRPECAAAEIWSVGEVIEDSGGAP